MKSVDQMLMDGEDRHSVLKTMPDRTDEEQVRVWSEGLGVIARRITQRTNNAKDALIDRVAGGTVHGLFFDPLDECEQYVKNELRRSRSREEGERKRQRWLMDVLVAIGAARALGASNLYEYPPARRMMDEDEEQTG